PTARPAGAESDVVVKRADGERQAQTAAAQAAAERTRLAGEAEARVTVAKGEAQARIISLNADAEAHRTSVEGNAEAEITLTQGESAAKALALRAEAYKQFNEAAIIQTVLGMLPDIVRAAAEPMGNIDSLTVLSSDGASDIVKTTTRTVAEAGAAVKSLTGLDVPSLISEAVGRQSSNASSAGRTDQGQGGAPAPARSRRARSTSPRGETSPPNDTQPDPTGAQRFADAVETVEQAGSVTPPEQPAPIAIPENATPATAAAMVQEALDRVPGIRRYADMPLSDLVQRGPRAARSVWRAIPDSLRQRIGDENIGAFLARRRDA
ncbi:MAG: flotillin domain-containing protein, partial [Candidatus Limnocylindria bacterium]